MKTMLLLFTGLLMNFTTVAAEIPSNNNNTLELAKHYRYAQPISFTERGVTFFIFPDGSFDFNTNNKNTHHRSKSKRNHADAISRDRKGVINSINNVDLKYDRYGKITKIGSIKINYERGKKGVLKQIGNLRVKYNKWNDIASVRGYVNRDNRHVTYTINKQNHYAKNNRYDNDDNYYYYKQNGDVKKQKKR